MRSYVLTARPKRHFSTLSRAARIKQLPRPKAKINVPALNEPPSINAAAVARLTQFQLDPYLDYGRFLTAEGGILIVYKDVDQRWRHIIWRLFVWTIFEGFEADYLLNFAPRENRWLMIMVLLAAALLNWFIVKKPVELYRRVEIRRDCMIVDSNDVFWARYIEGGLPSCRPDAEGNQSFCGIYGTRFVKYLTIRRFDEHDRMPEVMSAHLQDAMRQLWMVPH